METEKFRCKNQYMQVRKKMRMRDIDQTYLAERLGVTQATISRKFTGNLPWKLEEVYLVMSILNEPPEKVHEFFPPLKKGS